MLKKRADPPGVPPNPLPQNAPNPNAPPGGAQPPPANHGQWARDFLDSLMPPQQQQPGPGPAPAPTPPPVPSGQQPNLNGRITMRLPPGVTHNDLGGQPAPVHTEGGITVPPPSQPSRGNAGAGQPPNPDDPTGRWPNLDGPVSMRLPPGVTHNDLNGLPPGTLPPPQFGGSAGELPPAQFAGEPRSTGMGGGSGAGPGIQQSPSATPAPVAGLQAYTQQAATRLSKLPPEGTQQVMQGAVRTVNEIMERNPGSQQQLQQIMRGGQLPITMQQGGVQRLQTQGFDLPAAWQTFQGMQPLEQFLLVSGLGLGAIGLISALSGQGGIGSFLMAALGLGAAGGAAAHGGLFGQGAQQTMQGMLGTQQPTPPAAGANPAAPAAGAPAAGAPAAGGATPTAQGRIRLIDQAATSQPWTLPALFTDLAGELPPAQRTQLDQAAQLHSRIQAGGMTGQIAQMAYDRNDVNGELTRLGVSPQAIPAILSAWARWSPANPPRPPQTVRPAA